MGKIVEAQLGKIESVTPPKFICKLGFYQLGFLLMKYRGCLWLALARIFGQPHPPKVTANNPMSAGVPKLWCYKKRDLIQVNSLQT